MRHGKKFNHLTRKRGHRKAMLANMASSLIKHKKINTTVAKAKALRIYVEPLITKSKSDTTHSRRIVFRYLRDKYAVAELFREVTPKVADRPGGYTRILKTGNRLGDNAEMCLMELVDFNETMLAEPKTKKTKTRARRGGKKKTSVVSGDEKSVVSKAKTAESNIESTKEKDTKEIGGAEIKQSEETQPSKKIKEEQVKAEKGKDQLQAKEKEQSADKIEKETETTTKDKKSNSD